HHRRRAAIHAQQPHDPSRRHHPHAAGLYALRRRQHFATTGMARSAEERQELRGHRIRSRCRRRRFLALDRFQHRRRRVRLEHRRGHAAQRQRAGRHGAVHQRLRRPRLFGPLSAARQAAPLRVYRLRVGCAGAAGERRGEFGRCGASDQETRDRDGGVDGDIRPVKRGLCPLLWMALWLPLAGWTAPLTIFAAASLKPALDDLAAHGALGKPAPRLVYAASSSLARQIEQGAPADVFISADEDWMDDLAKHGEMAAGTRSDLLGNTLVLVAPKTSNVQVDLSQPQTLRRALGMVGRLSIALPQSVPAGRYASQSLHALGLWDSVTGKLAMSRDVRAALELVARGECPLGIVYRSDAISEPRVRV